MKILINESQKNKIIEAIRGNKVTCSNCGWKWSLSDGEDDPYICHKCKTDNSNLDEYIGKKVKVYYNLHKNTFSVTYKERVIGLADFVRLTDVEFKVRPTGKEKVRKEKSKNVHAFVIGTMVDYCLVPCETLPEGSSDTIVTYDPYIYDSFVIKSTKEPILSANEVEMINGKNKIFVVN
jgi:hypothetical protein